MGRNRFPEVIGALMAGGRGERIGGPKAALELAGRPLIAHPLSAFERASIETLVVAKRDTPLPPLGIEVLHEPDEPAHPLCGIVAALERAPGGAVVVCGCDMPFVSPALLARLATSDEPLVVPRAAGRLHPLLARYGVELLEPLRAGLAAERALQEVVAELGPVPIEENDLRALGEPALLLFNVNDRADLAEAERLLAADDR